MTDTNRRTTDLRQVLIEHRRALLAGVYGRIRDGRAERPAEVRDAVDDSDAHVQTDLELGLLQMRAETLKRIDEALAHLAARHVRRVCRLRGRDLGPAPARLAVRGAVPGLRSQARATAPSHQAAPRSGRRPLERPMGRVVMRRVVLVAALLAAFGGGWAGGASGRWEANRALRAALVQNDLLEARVSLLHARVSLYEGDVADVTRRLEEARAFVERAAPEA